MRALLIGSRAMAYVATPVRPDGPDGWPMDYDLIIDKDDFDKWAARLNPVTVRQPHPGKYIVVTGGSHRLTQTQYEFELAEPGSSGMWFLDAAHSNRLSHTVQWYPLCKPIVIAPPGALIAIKRSHLYWQHNWRKHIGDYHALLAAGYTMDGWEEGYKLRLQEKLRYDPPKTQTSLDVPNEKFFHVSEGALRRVYEHDDLHRVVAYHERPLYERSKPDLGKAIMSKDMFMNLSESDRLGTVREEAYAIALERRVIPYLDSVEPLVSSGLLDSISGVPRSVFYGAYSYALMRICTTLTRGWFRDFAIENWPLVNTPDVDYVGKFLKARASGSIIPK